ncbi:MAG TPA: hypothetical protein VMM60_18445 [Ilumatobacter sp.]|nr:hypothetical protein [Ilumatobacter sp.]
MSVEATWRELVTVALLGTDRREPPELPAGPLADAVADAMPPSPAARLLAEVGVVTAARRAAFLPLPPAPQLQPPAADARPWCSTAAVDTWREIIAEWPVLEDEWVLTVIDSGHRVPPDVLVELLQRHRGDAVRRARVELAGGPVAAWLTEHVPSLAPASKRPPPVEAVTMLPDLAMPPELTELLALDAHTFVGRILPGFESLQYGAAHKAVLVNLFARCRPAVLLDTAEALSRVGFGLAFAMSDLCRLRHRMLTDFS